MSVEQPAAIESHGVASREPSRLRGSTRNWGRLIGESQVAKRLEELLERAADIESTVLITGETGSGKEEVARALHQAGPRAEKPFLAINCGAMAATLIESQLFGHEKGAFTGAVGASRGAFRAADGGIVFLDEIGEMPLELQPRLLRVLQQREVTPLGSTAVFPVDVQVVAATNRDLAAEVRKGTFREDLYYRLNTIELAVPPLRERLADIPLFVEHFARHCAEKFSRPLWKPDADTIARFMRYRWPGNIRQLAQTIERIYAFGAVPDLPDETVQTAAPAAPIAPATEARQPEGDRLLPVLNLDELRRLAVRQALAVTAGHKGQAAQLLGVHLNTMTRLVAEVVPEASRRREQTPGRSRTRPR